MKPDKPQTLLVTGGCGYIGSQLVRRALAGGYQVRVLDSSVPETADQDLPLQNIQFFRGSITDRRIIEACTAGADYLVHLAGVSDGRAGKADPERTRRVNSETTGQLLQIAREAGVQRFLFASTMGVYGNQYDIPLIEALPLKPVDPYSASKAAGEAFVTAAAGPTFCTTSLRIAMVYGAGPKIREDFLLNQLCKTAVTAGSLTIMGGRQRRPQIHLDDLASLFLSLLHSPMQDINGKAFNAVESNPTLLDMVQQIQEALPRTDLNVLPARESEDSFEMNGRLLAEVTGFRPATSLSAGVRGLINHYQTVPVR